MQPAVLHSLSVGSGCAGLVVHVPFRSTGKFPHLHIAPFFGAGAIGRVGKWRGSLQHPPFPRAFLLRESLAAPVCAVVCLCARSRPVARDLPSTVGTPQTDQGLHGLVLAYMVCALPGRMLCVSCPLTTITCPLPLPAPLHPLGTPCAAFTHQKVGFDRGIAHTSLLLNAHASTPARAHASAHAFARARMHSTQGRVCVCGAGSSRSQCGHPVRLAGCRL